MHSPIVVRPHPQKGLLHTLTPHNEQEEHVGGVKCPPCELWQKTILTCCFLTCQPHWMLGFWKLNKTGNICYFTYSMSYMYISPVKYCMYQYLKQPVKAKWVILNDFKDQDPFWLLSFLKEFEKLLRTSTKFLSDNVRNESIFLPFSFFHI